VAHNALDTRKSKELTMFKKLLPILFLFTGFQANAALIGNLTYDGTYISGDGRTYLGLNTIASWDYATTLASTQVGGAYEGFRIANTADADFFIGSLFGANVDNCSTVDGVASNLTCGTVAGWTDGIFGDNFSPSTDSFFFLSDEHNTIEVGLVSVDAHTLIQYEIYSGIAYSDYFSDTSSITQLDVTWLLVNDTVASVPEPSIIALMGLGIFGIGFARRRRQS
jgi:hypothetical protein